jgi:hypothetical protein
MLNFITKLIEMTKLADLNFNLLWYDKSSDHKYAKYMDEIPHWLFETGIFHNFGRDFNLACKCYVSHRFSFKGCSFWLYVLALPSDMDYEI